MTFPIVRLNHSFVFVPFFCNRVGNYPLPRKSIQVTTQISVADKIGLISRSQVVS